MRATTPATCEAASAAPAAASVQYKSPVRKLTMYEVRLTWTIEKMKLHSAMARSTACVATKRAGASTWCGLGQGAARSHSPSSSWARGAALNAATTHSAAKPNNAPAAPPRLARGGTTRPAITPPSGTPVCLMEKTNE